MDFKLFFQKGLEKLGSAYYYYKKKAELAKKAEQAVDYLKNKKVI